MMKMQTHKGTGTTRTNNNRVVFELKRKVVAALNKLADRDTYQLGLQDLHTMVECLNPEGVSPFLSCILDTDSEQKNTVRKECVRLMGHLSSFHPHRVAPYLGKIVSSIVKRLKDPDTVVRDACVETIGIIASKLDNQEDAGDGVFVSLIKPLFEALGEQNKQLQSGSALCLSKVIDCTRNPPLSILQQMLNRTIKLLKNPHFVAKPAVIQLNTSIIKAGGAPSQNLLSAAMHSIQDALKSIDWNTRKAASVALGDIASSDDPLLGFHRASCIHGLESCRFDKVKPVRETVLQAIKRWQCHPVSPTPERSETGSSFRGNYLCKDGDVTSVSPLGKTEFFIRKPGGDSSKAKFSVSDRAPGQKFDDKPQHFKNSSWQLEMGVSKSPNASVTETQSETLVKSSTSSIFMGSNTMKFGMAAGDMRSLYAGSGYAPPGEKSQFLSTTNIVDDYCKSKFSRELNGLLIENALENSAESSLQSAIEEVSSGEKSRFTKSQDRNSFGSTVTNSKSQVSGCCCMQTSNVLSAMKKQLLEIENKQSTIVDLLQVLTDSTTNSLSMTQSKVVALGNTIDQIADSLLREGRYSNKTISRFSRTVNSPGDSSFMSSPSDGINSELPSRSSRNVGFWEEKECKVSVSPKVDMSMWATSPGYISKNPKMNVSSRNFMLGKETVGNGLNGALDSFPTTVVRHLARECEPQDKVSNWKCVKRFVNQGDLESAYAKALGSEDERLLVELLDQNGPALDRITRNTANNLLTALASHLYQMKNIQTIIPWIQQIVDLSSTHGLNYLGISSNLKKELLMAIQEAASMTFASPLQKRSLSQLNTKLCLLWGKS
ncbi:unnamed protein product [Rhodiola kirilowii]